MIGYLVAWLTITVDSDLTTVQFLQWRQLQEWSTLQLLHWKPGGFLGFFRYGFSLRNDLVGGKTTPLNNITQLSQLGWLFPIYGKKSCSKPQISITIIFPLLLVYTLWKTCSKPPTSNQFRDFQQARWLPDVDSPLLSAASWASGEALKNDRNDRDSKGRTSSKTDPVSSPHFSSFSPGKYNMKIADHCVLLGWLGVGKQTVGLYTFCKSRTSWHDNIPMWGAQSCFSYSRGTIMEFGDDRSVEHCCFGFPVAKSSWSLRSWNIRICVIACSPDAMRSANLVAVLLNQSPSAPPAVKVHPISPDLRPSLECLFKITWIDEHDLIPKTSI